MGADHAKNKVRGLARVRHHFTIAMTAYNLIRMPRLLFETALNRPRSQTVSRTETLDPVLNRGYGPGEDRSSTAC